MKKLSSQACNCSPGEGEVLCKSSKRTHAVTAATPLALPLPKEKRQPPWSHSGSARIRYRMLIALSPWEMGRRGVAYAAWHAVPSDISKSKSAGHPLGISITKSSSMQHQWGWTKSLSITKSSFKPRHTSVARSVSGRVGLPNGISGGLRDPHPLLMPLSREHTALTSTRTCLAASVEGGGRGCAPLPPPTPFHAD